MLNIRRIITYGFVQGLSYLIDVSTFYIMVHVLSQALLLDNFLGKLLAASVGFCLHYRYTFRSQAEIWPAVANFFAVVLLNILLVLVLFEILSRGVHLDALAAKVAADLTGIAVTYILLKYVFSANQ